MRRLTDEGALQRHRLCGANTCSAAVDRLWALSDRWTRRGPAFFTLGAATYLDVCGGTSLARYDHLHQAADPVIRDHFTDLLEPLRTAIADLTGQGADYHPALALPGFHIFLAGSLHLGMRDNLHLDLQHTYLPLPADLFTPTLTFTLPLETPVGGAGIEFCLPAAGDPRGRLVEEPYVAGELLVHSGRALHRRAHRPASDRCRRITLQGHGVLIDGRWRLYW